MQRLYQRKADSIAAEAALDGLYIIRTSVSATRMDAADCVRNYKALAKVERAFRSLKSIDLKILEQWALERAGQLDEEPYKRGHRVGILEHALEPLAPALPPATRDRLHRALSVIYGIESYGVLKDIWGLPDREIEKIALWMADALIEKAVREAARAQRTKGKVAERAKPMRAVRQRHA